MKLEFVLAALLTSSAVVEAVPFGLLKRAKPSADTKSASNALEALLTKTFDEHNSTATTATKVNATTSIGNSTVSSSNRTRPSYNHTGYSNGTNTSITEPTLQYIISGGKVPINNSSSATNYTKVSNSTRSLNITELYGVASKINETISSDDVKGAVVVANSNSLEGLGFLTDLIFNEDKPIVISEDPKLGAVVADDEASEGRGTIVVDKSGLIYQGSLAPGEKCVGIPIGIVVGDKVQYYYDNALESPWFGNDSTITANFTDFTNIVDFEDTSAPIVPIIFDGDYSTDLVDELSDKIQGLVVITTNATESSIVSLSLPIVYTSDKAPFDIISSDDVPEGTIGGGVLTATKAQLLLSVAIANGVDDVDTLKEVFA